jgi:RHS repeat-associated protein
MEKDDEIKGNGNSYDFMFRIYDSRIGKFLSVDPLSSDYPWLTPFAFAENQPIWAIDIEGLEKYIVILDNVTNPTKVTVTRVLDENGIELELDLRYKRGMGKKVTTKEILVLKRNNDGSLSVVSGKSKLTEREEFVMNNGKDQNQIKNNSYVGYTELGIRSKTPILGDLIIQRGAIEDIPVYENNFIPTKEGAGSGNFILNGDDILSKSNQAQFDIIAKAIISNKYDFQNNSQFSDELINSEFAKRGVESSVVSGNGDSSNSSGIQLGKSVKIKKETKKEFKAQ